MSLWQWQRLVSDITKADIGKIENWCRSHVAAVPHELIIRALLQPVYAQLQDHQSRDFTALEAIHIAVKSNLRWPGEVIRQSLRAAPTLLSNVLELRSALRAAV